MKVIYDVGASLGEDIEYYLLKADKVVAIEANPYLIDDLRKKFDQAISDERLFIVHGAISREAGNIKFYVNHKAPGLSRVFYSQNISEMFGELADSVKEFCSEDAWEPVNVPAIKLSKIISDHGKPYFIKIDIENSDSIATQDLYETSIHPPFLSVEFSSWYSLCHMLLMGYNNFQIVNMNIVQFQFHQYPITTLTGEKILHDFKQFSSGPFGEDLPGWWVDFERMAFMMASRRLIFGDGNWYDIHVRT